VSRNKSDVKVLNIINNYRQQLNNNLVLKIYEKKY